MRNHDEEFLPVRETHVSCTLEYMQELEKRAACAEQLARVTAERDSHASELASLRAELAKWMLSAETADIDAKLLMRERDTLRAELEAVQRKIAEAPTDG